jgi:hypothetical protein
MRLAALRIAHADPSACATVCGMQEHQPGHTARAEMLYDRTVYLLLGWPNPTRTEGAIHRHRRHRRHYRFVSMP